MQLPEASFFVPMEQEAAQNLLLPMERIVLGEKKESIAFILGAIA